jgi:M6 family metalloprotease-like protein
MQAKGTRKIGGGSGTELGAVGLLLVLALLASSSRVFAQREERKSGYLNVLWGDPPATNEEPGWLLFSLVDEHGTDTYLSLGEELLRATGGLAALNGRRAEITTSKGLSERGVTAESPAEITSLRLLPELTEDTAGNPDQAAVTGSQPWISILCKFSDIPTEPEPVSFFQGMYANTPGGLDHYWREVSYDGISVAGSIARDWVSLPHPRSFYVSPPSAPVADLGALFNDCTAAADAAGADFSNGGTGGFKGINMMFNADLDCCAWGGTRWATLDGVTKVWRVTWEPPWAYANEGVIAHEMGHGFGLPHSTNWDNDGNPYDSPWDVMSAPTSYAVSDPTYGRLGKHTISYHKDNLGWIPPARIFEPPGDGSFSIQIDHLALSSTSAYRMAKIPVPGTDRFYSVEVRERQGDYDGNLPGNAVLVFEIDPGRREPAWLYDETVPPADFSDNEGSMWKVGEIFEDAASEIEISVDGTTPEGFSLTITVGPPPLLQANPQQLAFGDGEVGTTVTRALMLSNPTAGTAPLEVAAMALSDTFNFSLDVNGGSNPCLTTAPTIATGQHCTVSLRFHPGAEGALSESLTIQSNGQPASLTVPLSGTGVVCTAGIDDEILEDIIENGSVTIEACSTITAGPYEIVAPGNVIFRAPLVILRNAFVVNEDARFTVE